jgi:phosphoserine phosphatase
MKEYKGFSVGFDMDGVLCDFVGTLIPIIEERFGLKDMVNTVQIYEITDHKKVMLAKIKYAWTLLKCLQS